MAKLCLKAPIADIIHSACVFAYRTTYAIRGLYGDVDIKGLYRRRRTLSFGAMPSSRRPFPRLSAWVATSVYVCQVYSPKWSFVNTFPLSCFSLSSPRTCLVPKHFLSEYILLEYLKSLSIVSIFSGAFCSVSCKEIALWWPERTQDWNTFILHSIGRGSMVISSVLVFMIFALGLSMSLEKNSYKSLKLWLFTWSPAMACPRWSRWGMWWSPTNGGGD